MYTNTFYKCFQIVCNVKRNLKCRYLKKGLELHLPITPRICNNLQILGSPRPLLPSCTKGVSFKDFVKRSLHTSNPNKALPPIVWVVLRPLLRVGAIITGRSLRKWWRNLPKNKRDYILKLIKKNQQNILIAGLLSGGAAYTYYIMHLVEDPISTRKRFLVFSEKQILQMAVIECEMLLENYKDLIMQSGYHYNNVLHITQQIVYANRHLPGIDRNWKVFIINDEDIKNAFVLPNGYIFVFTGIVKMASNQDQLAVIIGHEMSHALLSHSAEIVSKTHLLQMLLLLPLVVIWTLFPDSVAVFSHYLTEYVTNVVFELPFSRSLETEADVVGLGLISRACFDPKQASILWRKMEVLADEEEVEWMSTHPSFQTRYETLEELMPKALKIFADFCKKS